MMLTIIVRRTVAILTFSLLSASALAIPVIPGASGFGIDTPAARGGSVIKVTNLNDSGSGSLRACVNAAGPRYCVFEVSGTIKLESNLVIYNPNIVIAGQTAPAPGILLRGSSLIIKASDVVVQHISVRVGDDPDGPDPASRDSIKIVGNDPIRNVVIDHCSFGWSVDEVIETWRSWDNLSILNSIIAEPLEDSIHPKGTHGFTALLTSDSSRSRISLIGNLIAHGRNRNPRSSAANFVFVNNVVYNPGDAGLILFNTDGISSANAIIGNVFIEGSNTIATPIRLNGDGVDGGAAFLEGSQVYLSDNLAWNSTSDPWSIVDNQSDLLLSSVQAFAAPLDLPTRLSVRSTADDAVLEYVLGNAGARPGQRIASDERIVNHVRKKAGQIINCVTDDGSARCAKNGGGWPNMAKNDRKLSLPSDPSGDSDGDGYTNVEEWLHAMAAEVEGRDLAPPKPPTLQD